MKAGKTKLLTNNILKEQSYFAHNHHHNILWVVIVSLKLNPSRKRVFNDGANTPSDFSKRLQPLLTPVNKNKFSKQYFFLKKKIKIIKSNFDY